MIRLTDAGLLALTKLRARRIRLFITVIISSLLLGILTVGLLVAAGVFKSIDDFTHQGLNDRYLVSVSPSDSYDGIDQNRSVIARAEKLNAERIAAKTATAKKLGLEYTPTDEDGVFRLELYKGAPPFLNYTNPSVQQAIDEFFDSVPYNQAVIDSLKKRYNATATYPFKPYYSGFTLREMKKGVEQFGEEPSPSITDPRNFPMAIYGLDDSLARPFEFDAETLQKNKPAGESIPVIVPYSYAEKQAGYDKLSDAASSQQKLERIQQVRERAPSIHPVACYRNTMSESQIKDALIAIKEAERNKANKNYVAPNLVYGLPDEKSCGAAIVTRDKRTAQEKSLQKKQDELAIAGTNSQSPLDVEARQHKLTFQIVGIAPDAPTLTEGLSLTKLMTTVAGSNLENAWIVPNHLRAEAGSLLADELFADYSKYGSRQDIFEFASATDAKKFIDEVKCPLSTCSSPKREFVLRQMGSNSIIVDQLRSTVVEMLLIVGLVVVVLASLVMMGNVGRMITDSRRETAVFRAIGAKRIDITKIYLVYIVIVAVMIALVGYGLGLLAAFYIESTYGSEATAQALLNFGTGDMTRTFKLFTIRIEDGLVVVGLSLLAAIVGSVIPLSRNVRRNPIRDMRDE